MTTPLGLYDHTHHKMYCIVYAPPPSLQILLALGILALLLFCFIFAICYVAFFAFWHVFVMFQRGHWVILKMTQTNI
jgi:hypothetical protein